MTFLLWLLSYLVARWKSLLFFHLIILCRAREKTVRRRNRATEVSLFRKIGFSCEGHGTPEVLSRWVDISFLLGWCVSTDILRGNNACGFAMFYFCDKAQFTPIRNSQMSSSSHIHQPSEQTLCRRSWHCRWIPHASFQILNVTCMTSPWKVPSFMMHKKGTSTARSFELEATQM